MRYHTYLCSCCQTAVNGGRTFARDLEPSAPFIFDSSYEKELTSISKARGKTVALSWYKNAYHGVGGPNMLCVWCLVLMCEY